MNPVLNLSAGKHHPASLPCAFLSSLSRVRKHIFCLFLKRPPLFPRVFPVKQVLRSGEWKSSVAFRRLHHKNSTCAAGWESRTVVRRNVPQRRVNKSLTLPNSQDCTSGKVTVKWRLSWRLKTAMIHVPGLCSSVRSGTSPLGLARHWQE